MTNVLKKFYNFIVKSSADPRATSASIKFLLVGFIPYAMQALDLVCKFGERCYAIDASVFELIIDTFANAIFYALTFFSSLGALWALGRKFIRTFTGNNLALRDN